MSNLCVIPARGGSKRIPRKNIKDFLGKPIIAYSIENALKSKLFDKVIVSSEDEEIIEISKSYGADIIVRPKELADDYTGTGEVLRHAVKTLKEQGNEYDYVCVLYATAPLLDIKYLIEGFERLKNSSACHSFSVTSMPYPFQRAFKIVDERCEMFFPQYFSCRSQELEAAYHDAGEFYWYKSGCKSSEVFFGKDSIPIVLPRYLVQDIDTLEDWYMAEKLYKAIYL